jgi:[ribosomal protein S5]-alanine N-acetyltransferase
MNYPLRLETARLWTRPVTMDDQHAWTAFLANEEATRYLPSSDGKSIEQWAEAWMVRQLGRYAEQRCGHLALIHKETGAFIGQCGLLRQSVDDVAELEVGYHIFPQYWRQGYASEAAQAFRDLAFENNLAPSIISLIHQQNLGSQAVARANGMQRERTTHFLGLDAYVYRIHRAEWLQLKNNPPA